MITPLLNKFIPQKIKIRIREKIRSAYNNVDYTIELLGSSKAAVSFNR